jgi:ribonuclease P protein component
VSFAALGEESAPRVAYAVGKRSGGAVVRNRLRRRLRAVVAGIAPQLVPGAYLVMVAPGAFELSHEELKTQVTAAMTAAPAGGRP